MVISENIKSINKLITQSLSLWQLPFESKIVLLNISENYTYKILTPKKRKFILRLHRKDYHSINSIKSEHAWLKILNKECIVKTPSIIPGKNGQDIQCVKIKGKSQRFLVMFEFLEGQEPTEKDNLTFYFEKLGEIAAKTHIHSMTWKKPKYFERFTWDLESIIGSNSIWGKWVNGPNLTNDIIKSLLESEFILKKRLKLYSKTSNRFGLIHADMRLSNLIINGGIIQLIDFDDCGYGWFMYDFATSISFMENRSDIHILKKAWIRGYRKKRTLTIDDEIEIESFIVLRRLNLLGWIGSHKNVYISKKLAPDFAKITKKIADNYINKFKI